MNTMTVVVSSLALLALTALFVYVFWYTVKNWRDRQTRRLGISAIISMIIFFLLALLSVLNSYGVARLPVLNEVERRSPTIYQPKKLPPPPTNGSTQPSSQPAIDQHKEDMERIKRDGL